MNASKNRRYSYELKKQVVELYFEGRPINEIVDKFHLSSRKRIYEWVKKAKNDGFSSLQDHRGIYSAGKKKKEKESLEEENYRLKLEVAYLKKLIALNRG